MCVFSAAPSSTRTNNCCVSLRGEVTTHRKKTTVAGQGGRVGAGGAQHLVSDFGYLEHQFARPLVMSGEADAYQ